MTSKVKSKAGRIAKKALDELSFIYKRIFYDHKFYENYDFEEEVKIEELAGFEKLPYTFGIVADEIFYNSLQGVVDLVYITPADYKKQITTEIDVLLIVSSWRGLHNEWRGMVYDKEKHLKVVDEICHYYKELNPLGKTVFYSKEDPVNYEHFSEYSRLTDWVFTTAVEKVDDYKNYCHHEQVDVLKFGFNPYLFNPYYNKDQLIKNGVLFAGSWMRKYPERCKDLGMIFDGFIKMGMTLKIVDRNYAIRHAKYLFPRRYIKYCLPSLKHHQLIKLYQSFDTVININSITESKTMFAVRAYELLAMGKIVISNRSIGMEDILPEVIVVDDDKSLQKFLRMSENEKDELRQKGISNVFENHTMFHRVESIVGKVFE